MTDADALRLATFLAPAVRIEPELLRAVRLACLPDLDVGVEQDLWFGPLVDARSDAGISLAADVATELRHELARWWRGEDRALVETSRAVMAEVHAGVSPILAIEEELAWCEVVGDEAGLTDIVGRLADAVAAQRPGLSRWLARAWATLPDAVRTMPEGWLLAQVAASAGGEVRSSGEAPEHLRPEHLAALLDAVGETEMFLAWAPRRLRLGVAEAEADAAIVLPRTDPRLLEITVAGSPPARIQVPVDASVEVPAVGPVEVRTAAGAVYRLENPDDRLFRSVRCPESGTRCSIALFDQVALVSGIAERSGDGLDLARVVPEVSGQTHFLRRVADPAGDVAKLGELEVGAEVRTLAIDHATQQVIVVPGRIGPPQPDGLYAIDVGSHRLVTGAPLFDSSALLVGVVGRNPVQRAVPAQRFARAARRMDQLIRKDRSNHVLVVAPPDQLGELVDVPNRWKVPRGVATMVGDGGTLWIAEQRVDGVALRYRFEECWRGLLGREVGSSAVTSFPPGGVSTVVSPGVALDVDDVVALEELAHALLRGPEKPAADAAVHAPAATLGDAVSATDVHIILIPSPGGPVPTPVPMPFSGTIAADCSPDVLIEGRPAAVVGSVVINSPPHIASEPFLAPPSNRGTVVVGSSTVLINGRPAARAGDPVTTCNDPVDMPHGRITGGAAGVLIGTGRVSST